MLPAIGILMAFGLATGVSARPGHRVSRSSDPQNQAPQKKQSATLRGRVVDARTGEPLAKVRVIASGADQNTTTDENGSFTLENLPAGKVELYITTVSFGLVKKTITLKEGDNSDIQIALNEDAAALTEKVTVAANPFESTEPNAASEHLLNKRELQQLSSMLVGDPIRAAQALPGATTNDDYRSEFAVRGAGFDRVGLYLDGILTENFVHTIAGGYPDTGSLSVINADTVDSVLLMSGAFSSRYGDRTAAVLDIQTRDGNRVKTNGRVSASLTGLGAVVDGPFAHGRGSYLVAGRKSYVGYIVRRFNDEFHYTNNPPILNFEDGQGKFIYDLTTHSQVGFSLVFGDFVFDRNRDRLLLGINQVFRGNSRNLLVNGHWSYSPNPKVSWQTRLFGLRTTFKNTNRNDGILEDGHRTQLGVRSDVSFQPRASQRLEAGLYIRSINVDSLTQVFGFFSPTPFDFGSFKRRGTEQGYYAQDTWNSERRGLSLTGGARVEHSSVTGETNFSPRGSLAWSIDKNWKLRAAAGRYYQFPDFEQMFGRLGNRNLRSERATHYNASIERLFGNRTRVLAEVYDREDTNLFFSLNEPRAFGPTFVFTESPFQNSLRGHARGFELTVQRRSANKLSGWISYAYSVTQLNDARDGFVFRSDTDQTHTFNAYGNYRITGTWNLSGEWRYGSGEPIPGFIRQVGPDYFLAAQRNLTRLPYYNRIDVRVSKAFLFKKAKLTLTGEVLNLLNRNNLRYAGFDFYDFGTGRVYGQLDRVLPIIPSAGIVIEF